MADEHGPRDLVIAEAEGRIEFGDFLVPAQLAFIGEHRKKQRRQALGVRRDHEFGMLVDRLGRPERAHADAALPHDLALIDQCKADARSEEHTSELQSLLSVSYAVFCLQKKKAQQSIKR